VNPLHQMPRTHVREYNASIELSELAASRLEHVFLWRKSESASSLVAATSQASTPKLGPRKLDVATMYNTERNRPMYANKRALPVFLQRAS
jgi:hypothetical protein